MKKQVRKRKPQYQSQCKGCNSFIQLLPTQGNSKGPALRNSLEQVDHGYSRSQPGIVPVLTGLPLVNICPVVDMFLLSGP